MAAPWKYVLLFLVSLFLFPADDVYAADAIWSADHEAGHLAEWVAPAVNGSTRGGSYDSGDCTRPNDGSASGDDQNEEPVLGRGVSTEVARSGQYSMKMTAATDTAYNTGCRQFRHAESAELNEALYYSAWLYFPEKYTVNNWSNIIQFKSQSDSRNDAVWVLELRNRENGDMYFMLRWKGIMAGPTQGESTGLKHYRQDLVDITPGEWTHVEVYLKQSNDIDYSGQLTVWQDGVQIYDMQNVATKYRDNGDNRWAINAYGRDIAPNNELTIYVDDAKISRTRVGNGGAPVPTTQPTQAPSPTVTPANATPTSTVSTPTPTQSNPTPTSTTTPSTTNNQFLGTNDARWVQECSLNYVELSGVGMGNPEAVTNPQTIMLSNHEEVTNLSVQVSGRGFRDNAIPSQVTFSFDNTEIVNSAVNNNGESWSFESTLQPAASYLVSTDTIGSDSYKTPRAVTLYALRNAESTWTSIAEPTHGYVYWKKAGSENFSTNVTIPPLPSEKDVYVSIAVIDNDHADQPLDVSISAGNSTAVQTENTSSYGSELNIFNMVLEGVEENTSEITIGLNSGNGTGESAAMVGYAINYPCGSSANDLPFSTPMPTPENEDTSMSNESESTSEETQSLIERIQELIARLIEYLNEILGLSDDKDNVTTPTPTPSGNTSQPTPTTSTQPSITQGPTPTPPSDIIIGPDNPLIDAWVVNGMERLTQNETQKSERSISINAAGNEYEPFQIAIKASNANLNSVNVKKTDFIDGNGNVIPQSNITLYREHFITIDRGSSDWGGSNPPQGPGTYPDPLIPFTDPQSGADLSGSLDAAPFTVQTNTNEVIWVDVYVPPNTPAGRYLAKLTITTDQGDEDIGVDLTVWNFNLPTKPHLVAIADLWKSQSNNKASSEEVLKHKINRYNVGKSNQAEFIQSHGLQAQDAGLWAGYDYSTCESNARFPGPPSSSDVSSAASGQLTDIVFAHYVDEPHLGCQDQFDRMRAYGQAIRAGGVQPLIPLNDKMYRGLMGNSHAESAADIWVINGKGFDDSTTLVREAQARGEEVWSFTALVQDDYTPKWTLDFPSPNYRLHVGFISQSLGLTGMEYWVFDNWSSDPWNNVVSSLGAEYPADGVFVYPGNTVGTTGIAPGMRLKWLREGIEDYDYVQILKELGQEARALELSRQVGPDWRNWSRDVNQILSVKEQLGQEIHNLR